MNEIDVRQLLNQLRSTAAAAQGRPEATGGAAGAGVVDFSQLVKGAINSVNTQQMQADKLITAFEMGDPKVHLSEVMVSMQKASISFQAMTQVRNKVVAAYQEIMNMQV